MMKSSTSSFGFSSSLFLFFFFILASIVVYSEDAFDCTYLLNFQTGTFAGAGTDSNIKVTIGNSNGESLEIPDLMEGGMLPSGQNHFEKGDLDIFEVQAPCIKIPVCKINVTSDGSGREPGWYLKHVKVNSFGVDFEKNPISKTDFEFNQWLATDEPPNKLTASRDVCESG